MNARVLYEERCGWSWWVHTLILITSLAAVSPLLALARGNVGPGEGALPTGVAVLCLLLGFGIPLGLYSFMGQLRTRVTQEGVDISWGFSEVISKKIPFDKIEGAEPVKYSPIGEFGGWGIRMGGKQKQAWTIRGKRAALLHLSDGTRFYLGSENPERIVQWVTSAKRRSDS